ncbi:MAG: 4-alpha-glucanotransferase, partial [Deltaproteobacteria bacterium]|nr:4-alpha-glucanotransferase [Deltaproteobacteria bacterium]
MTGLSVPTHGLRHNLDEFISANPWVKDYGLFMALKQKYNQKAWFQWPEELSRRDPNALNKTKDQLKQEISYFQFEQYLFFSQWQKLRNYANKNGIQIIGDLPIYVGLDSVDVWANQNIFELDPKTALPTAVAGVPPDYFSKTGQLWGNPLYRWNTKNADVKEQLHNWWVQRLEMIFSTVDVIRIDHFRGFESYWSVPAKEKTAINGKWLKGPGIQFFQLMEKRLGKLPIIAEDLGIITPAVERLRDELGFPGMKILLFAFDGNIDNSYLPYNYTKNCVVYTGTHDNDTAIGWYLDPEVSREAKRQAKRYATREDN